MVDDTSGVFQGVRVLEVGRTVASALAGLLLAENGAAVTRVVRAGTVEPLESRVYDRGKRTVAADVEVPHGQDAIRELSQSCDVVLCDLTPGERAGAGLSFATLADANPTLVYVAMPPFGEVGPLADLVADEWAVSAFGGVFAEQASIDLTPTFILAPLASAATAILAAGAAAVGLIHARRSGIGQQITVSQLAGAVAGQLHNFVQVEGVSALASWRRRQPLGPNPVFTMLQTADEWMALAVLSRPFFERLCEAIGRPDLPVDRRFVAAPFEYEKEEDGDALLAEMKAIFRTRTREQWMAVLAELDVPGGAVLTHAQTMAEEQVSVAGLRLDFDDPQLGRTLQPAIGLRFSRSDGRKAEAERATGSSARDTRRGEPSASVRGPALAGVRVLDTGTYIAGTVAGMLLADLGADVIKIEPPVGDPFRALGMEFLGWNRGKRAMVVDLKLDAGRELLYRLVRDADIYIENLRPGIAERLGVGYETLSAINPRLVYASVTAFGPEGPKANQPGFDLLLQAYTGVGRRQGGNGDPVYHTIAFPDYGASMLAFFGIVSALYERESSGLGQRVETSLLGAAMFFQAADFLLYEGKPADTRGGPLLRGTSPLYRMYRAADGWFFVDARGPEAYASFREVVGWGDAPSWDATVRLRADEAPADVFAAVFARGPRAEWLRRLRSAGVVAVPVMSPLALLEEEQFKAIGLVDARREHAEMGTVRQSGPLIQPSAMPAVVQRTGPLLGEHTREILAEAGFSADEVEAAIEAGAAWGR